MNFSIVRHAAQPLASVSDYPKPLQKPLQKQILQRCVSSKLLKFMARLEGFPSNPHDIDLEALFQVLSDWEHQLKHADVDFQEVRP